MKRTRILSSAPAVSETRQRSAATRRNIAAIIEAELRARCFPAPVARSREDEICGELLPYAGGHEKSCDRVADGGGRGCAGGEVFPVGECGGCYGAVSGRVRVDG